MNPIFVIMALSSLASAHQPVMDMAPRWQGGYGFQLRSEYHRTDHLFVDGECVGNPLGQKHVTHTQWLEGIYTLKREYRATLKVPWVRKNFRDPGLTRKAEGLGDVILSFPFKRYFNRQGWTGNFSLTPIFHLPTGSTSKELALGRGTLDYGASVSASIESFQIYTLLDLFFRWNTKGFDGIREGEVVGIDFDFGLHPYHSNEKNMGVFVMSGINARWIEKDTLNGGASVANSGGQTIEVVPTLVLYKDNVMWRAQYHVPVREKLHGTQLADSYSWQTGIGVVFQSLNPFKGG